MKVINILLLAFAIIAPVLVASDDRVVKNDGTQHTRRGQKASRKTESSDRQMMRRATWSKRFNNRPNSSKELPNRVRPTKPQSIDKPENKANQSQDSRCQCDYKWEMFKFNAFQGTADSTVPTGIPVSQLGGMYIYNSLLWQDSELITAFTGETSAFMTGICTRFQVNQVLKGGGQLLGAAACNFIYTISAPEAVGSLTVTGEVFDVVPSTLSITGGTEDFDGAHGSITLTPSYTSRSDGEDVFTQASYLEFQANVQVKTWD